jgi:hypothetical protein
MEFKKKIDTISISGRAFTGIEGASLSSGEASTYF